MNNKTYSNQNISPYLNQNNSLPKKTYEINSMKEIYESPKKNSKIKSPINKKYEASQEKNLINNNENQAQNEIYVRENHFVLLGIILKFKVFSKI